MSDVMDWIHESNYFSNRCIGANLATPWGLDSCLEYYSHPKKIIIVVAKHLMHISEQDICQMGVNNAGQGNQI